MHPASPLCDAEHEVREGLVAPADESIVLHAMLVHPHACEQTRPTWTTDRGLMRRFSHLATGIKLSRQQSVIALAEHLHLRGQSTLHRCQQRIRATAVDADEEHSFAMKRAILTLTLRVQLDSDQQK